MSSALKNFTITFAVALIVFMLLGFWAAPFLESAFDFSSMGSSQEESTEESTDVSDESSNESDVSQPVTNPEYDENGDVFTAVVMAVDNEKRPVSMAFINANGKTKQYTYCAIDTEIKISNEIGNMVPIKALFCGMAPNEIARCITAITGIETQYCLIFDRSALATIASGIPRANVVLPNNQTITVNNPKYKDYVQDPLLPIPEDLTVSVMNGEDGTVRLNDVVYERTNLEWLLEYNPNADGSAYNVIYKNICSSLIKQYLTSGSNSLAGLLSVCESNLTANIADEHLDTIFAYDEWNLNDYRYPKKSDYTADWETAIKNLRKYDGSYDISK